MLKKLLIPPSLTRLSPDPRLSPFLLMRRELFPWLYPPTTSSIPSNLLPSRLSEKLSAMIPLNLSEERIETSAKTLLITTMSPYQWWSKEFLLRLPLLLQEIPTLLMVHHLWLPASTRASLMTTERQWSNERPRIIKSSKRFTLCTKTVQKNNQEGQKWTKTKYWSEVILRTRAYIFSLYLRLKLYKQQIILSIYLRPTSRA